MPSAVMLMMGRARRTQVVRNGDRITRETKSMMKPEADAQEADAGIKMRLEESLEVEEGTVIATRALLPVTSGPVGSGAHDYSLQCGPTQQRA